MITLHILQLLQDNGFGTISLTGAEPNADLFFEKLPHDKNGVYIVAIGTARVRGQRMSQAFDLIARGDNDIDGATRLEAICDYFDATFGQTCDLPTVTGYSDTEYKRVMIQPTSSISNIGLDATDRVIYSVSALVTYNK